MSQRSKKLSVKSFVIMFVVCIIVCGSTLILNINRLSDHKKPLFVIKTSDNDYLGLGYKVYVTGSSSGIYLWGGSHKRVGDPDSLLVLYYVNYK